MDIVKTATDWARFEMLSTVAFMTFGLAFGLAVTDTLALQASGCDQATVLHKPRLLSDNGSS